MSEMKNQPCVMCGKKACTLREDEIDVPFFGRVFIFSMTCTECGDHKADLEVAEKKQPMQYTFEVTGEEDLAVKVIKSGEATLKIPRIIEIEPGPASIGYVTNVEGVLERVKKVIQGAADAEDDKDAKKKAKNLIKKLNNVILGRDKLKIILTDSTGNSAIVSDKAVTKKL